MSAPAAGKFQDHYVILGVDPKASSDVIQAAYAKLAQKYHKDNPATGNQEKFDAVNLAFEVLCDATLRAEFDKLKGIDLDDDKPRFSGQQFFENLSKQTALRAAILSVLYERRQLKPFRPSLSMRHLDSMINATNDEQNFAIWYLKQRGLAASDDKSNLQITVEGMDYLESARLEPELVLPFIKPAALSKPQAHAQTQAQTQDSLSQLTQLKTALKSDDSRESVSNVLTRALARR